MQETIRIFEDLMSIDTPYLSLVCVEAIEKDELLKITQLKNLKHLNASSTELVDEHLETIGHVNSIELLDLVLSEITDQGLRHLVKLTKLKELRLKDNPQLTDQCIEHLTVLKTLKLIHLGNTSITMNGLKQLISQLELTSVILDAEFEGYLEELREISSYESQLEIIVKGNCTISNGKIN